MASARLRSSPHEGHPLEWKAGKSGCRWQQTRHWQPRAQSAAPSLFGAGRIGAAWSDVHFDPRHLGQGKHRVVMEAVLHDSSVLYDYRRLERCRQTERNPAFDLRRDRVGIDHEAAVDRADHPVNSNLPRGRPRLRDLARPAAMTVAGRGAARAPIGQRRCLSRLLGGKLDHCAVARRRIEQTQPEFNPSLPAAWASSSMKLSIGKAFWPAPTDRQ
jgi:hypothetical protein